jgi:hypothetical protein
MTFLTATAGPEEPFLSGIVLLGTIVACGLWAAAVDWVRGRR